MLPMPIGAAWSPGFRSSGTGFREDRHRPDLWVEPDTFWDSINYLFYEGLEDVGRYFEELCTCLDISEAMAEITTLFYNDGREDRVPIVPLTDSQKAHLERQRQKSKIRAEW